MTSPENKDIQIMRLALGLSGLPCDDAAAETVLLVVDGIKKLKGKFSLKESSEIEYHIQKKYRTNKIISTEKVKV